MMPYNPIYGNYRTRLFGDIIPDLDNFNALLDELIVLVPSLTEDQRQLVYYLLMATYGNSHIANSNEEQFKLQLVSRIGSCAPAFFKYKQMQDALLNMNTEEMIDGGTSISNHASNPNTSPSDQTLNELPYIDSQNISKVKKNKLQAYAEVISLIDADLYRKFVQKFESLFIRITMPQSPLYYENDIEEEEQDNE